MIRAPGATLPPWRFVFVFGIVSLLADTVYEGARSVIGPFLGSLGAGAAMVGLITGLGEAFAFAGRLATGPLADRTRAYWPLTLAGYGLTVVAVPLLGFASLLWGAAFLVLAERLGKAVRSPAKDVLLSHAAGAVGRGRGFAVHEALDQIGAIAGPLAVAAVLVWSGGDYRPGFWMLAIPGVLVLALLVRLQIRVPDPAVYEPDPTPAQTADGSAPNRLPRAFWSYWYFTLATTLGFAGFGILSFHLADQQVVPTPAIPVIYAAAMAVDAVAAVVTGWLYDRIGRRVLLAVPVLSLSIAPLGFQNAPALAIMGVLVCGAVLGIQESTMRAAVADLVPARRRGTAYGVFAAGFGAATFAGSTLIGVLYAHSLAATIAVSTGIQIISVAAFFAIRERR